MKKGFIVIAAMAVVALAVAACGGGGGDPTALSTDGDLRSGRAHGNIGP